VQTSRPWGANLWEKFPILIVLGLYFYISAPVSVPNFTFIGAMCGEKPIFGPHWVNAIPACCPADKNTLKTKQHMNHIKYVIFFSADTNIYRGMFYFLVTVRASVFGLPAVTEERPPTKTQLKTLATDDSRQLLVGNQLVSCQSAKLSHSTDGRAFVPCPFVRTENDNVNDIRLMRFRSYLSTI